jgi:hypothetical protein
VKRLVRVVSEGGLLKYINKCFQLRIIFKTAMISSNGCRRTLTKIEFLCVLRLLPSMRHRKRGCLSGDRPPPMSRLSLPALEEEQLWWKSRCADAQTGSTEGSCVNSNHEEEKAKGNCKPSSGRQKTVSDLKRSHRSSSSF